MFDFLADYLFTKEEQPTMENFNARLEMLNALKNHWWKRRTVFAALGDTKTLNSSDIGSNVDLGVSMSLSRNSSASDTSSFEYSSNVLVLEGSGDVDLFPPVLNGSVSYNTYRTSGISDTLSSKYYKSVTGKIWYVETGAVSERAQLGNAPPYVVWLSPVREVIVSYGEWEYVQSSDRSAYPDSGEQDGYEYQYLGVPFENALGAPKIETGNYVGTGTYGEDNPNSLTLGFEAKVLFVYSTASIVGSTSQLSILETDQETFVNIGIGSSGYQNKVVKSDDGKTVSWYAEGSSGRANSQMNTAGAMYNYIAIG